MSYHNTSSAPPIQSTTNIQGQVAPAGFHYMPDGTLMSDIDHAKMYKSDQGNIITAFNLDLSNILAIGEQRVFTITGSNNSEFILEIKDNATGYYYNFVTNSFQLAQYRLEKSIISGSYKGNITFPAVTGSSDKYDIYLYAVPGTKHANYSEVRFTDGSLDINSSKGSNSLMMQKVIYQYSAITLTLQGYSPNATISSTFATSNFSLDKYKSKNKTAFSLTATSNAASSYKILKQPSPEDILSYLSLTVGSDPEDLPGEDIYPAVSNTDTVDGAIVGGGSVIKVVMDTDVVDKMLVGDKITAATSVDDVDGAVESGVKVVMDNNVAGKMAIGDRITGADESLDGGAQLASKIVIVAALNPDGDNVKEFSMSETVELADGERLIFTPKCNRSLTTVAVLNPDDDNVKEFSMSQNIGFIDGVTLSFSPQKNKRWPLDNINGLTIGTKIIKEFVDVNVTADSFIADYKDTITINEGYDNEQTIIKNSVPALDTKGQTPTVVDGLVTVQPGSVIFNNQQVLALGGDTIKIAGYGQQKILSGYGYDVLFTDLAIALTAITTTTTSAVSSSTTIPVASVSGALPLTTTISGIGIDPSVVDPTVNSRSVTSGAGNLELSAAQTLENGVTLTYANAGQVATITGNIEILKAGTDSQTIYFDIEKLLSMT